MFKNNCNCGDKRFYLQYKGAMVGKYCSGCNKWERWVSKKDVEIYHRNGYIVYKADTSKSSDNSNGTDFSKCCSGCNTTAFYLRSKGAMVGSYCVNCDKWSSWVGKKVVEDLKRGGYVVYPESYINPNKYLKQPSHTGLNSVDTVFNCSKCGCDTYYIKERGSNVGKYCSDCNKWVRWLKKEEVSLLQSKGFTLHNEVYMSHITPLPKDDKVYIDNATVYVSEYNRLNIESNVSGLDAYALGGDIGIDELHSNTNKPESYTNVSEFNKNSEDKCIVDSDNSIDKIDMDLDKDDSKISKIELNILKNGANMSLLEHFIRNTKKECSGCLLEAKCDMMVVKLCESISDAIDFVEAERMF